jgi:hypothetical protein
MQRIPVFTTMYRVQINLNKCINLMDGTGICTVFFIMQKNEDVILNHSKVLNRLTNGNI